MTASSYGIAFRLGFRAHRPAAHMRPAAAGKRQTEEITLCDRGEISPLLANIYLHEVLDQWFEQDVKPRLKGTSFMVRYADDAVLGFERQEDAERVFAVLAKRFEKYALTLHPQKTRLTALHRPGSDDPPGSGPGEPRSFDFLGF